jgi:hypothetical protein
MDRHEGPIGPRAARVDGAGEALLARAALAAEEDGRVGLRDAREAGQRPRESLALADEALEAGVALAFASDVGRTVSTSRERGGVGAQGGAPRCGGGGRSLGELSSLAKRRASAGAARPVADPGER